jgi:hypothetical protein
MIGSPPEAKADPAVIPENGSPDPKAGTRQRALFRPNPNGSDGKASHLTTVARTPLEE